MLTASGAVRSKVARKGSRPPIGSVASMTAPCQGADPLGGGIQGADWHEPRDPDVSDCLQARRGQTTAPGAVGIAAELAGGDLGLQIRADAGGRPGEEALIRC